MPVLHVKKERADVYVEELRVQFVNVPTSHSRKVLEHQGGTAESDGDDFKCNMAEIVRSFGRCVGSVSART